MKTCATCLQLLPLDRFSRRGVVGEVAFIERAACATWPLINICALVGWIFRVLYHAVAPR